MTIAQSVGIIIRGKDGMHPDSPLEATFARDMRALKFPPWQRNYRAIEGRKLEFDFAWPMVKFAVEIDGAVHRTDKRFMADFEKHALAMLADWKVLRLGSRQVRNGQGVRWAQALLFRILANQPLHTPDTTLAASPSVGLSDVADSLVGKG